MGFLKEFKEFAMKGNLVDIAVGFVMGAAFKEVVSSFTGGIVSPLIGLLFNADFNDLKYVITEGTPNDAGEIVGEIAVKRRLGHPGGTGNRINARALKPVRHKDITRPRKNLIEFTALANPGLVNGHEGSGSLKGRV